MGDVGVGERDNCQMQHVARRARVGSRMSRHGRLNEINAESGVLDIVLLRCPDRSRLLDPLNLVTGRPIPMLDGPLLATRIETRKDSG